MIYRIFVDFNPKVPIDISLSILEMCVTTITFQKCRIEFFILPMGKLSHPVSLRHFFLKMVHGFYAKWMRISALPDPLTEFVTSIERENRYYRLYTLSKE